MSNELAITDSAAIQRVHDVEFEKLKVVKDVIAKDCTDVELQFFAEVCKRTGLDPFMKQIYCVKRNSKGDDSEKKLTIQTGIDGFRIVAERTGKYAGQLAPQWCGPDGKWVDVWLDMDYPPNAARVGVLRKDWREPMWGVALYSEYVQMSSYTNKPSRMWAKMPTNQLSKCAESLALRKAFPMELSGIYTPEEMQQADVSNESAPDTGGNPIGTQAAADYVAAEKMAMLQQQMHDVEPLPPQPIPTGPLPPVDPPELTIFLNGIIDRYTGAQAFGKLHKEIDKLCGNDVPYYEFLTKHKIFRDDGTPHAGPDDLKGKSRAQIKKCVREIWEFCAKIAKEQQDPPASIENETAKSEAETT